MSVEEVVWEHSLRGGMKDGMGQLLASRKLHLCLGLGVGTVIIVEVANVAVVGSEVVQ